VDSIVLWQWIIQSRTNGANAAQSVLITLRGESGQAMMSWQLTNATPASYNGPTLQGKGSGDVAMPELVLTVGSIQIIAPRPYIYSTQLGRTVGR
jgi:phage tail-like protein